MGKTGRRPLQPQPRACPPLLAPPSISARQCLSSLCLQYAGSAFGCVLGWCADHCLSDVIRYIPSELGYGEGGSGADIKGGDVSY